jgi:hypothetical protein
MTMYRARGAIFLFALLIILFQTGAALAQETTAVDLEQRRVVVWINPILAMFTWYTAEVEIRLQEHHTVGVAGTFLQTDDGEKDDPLSEYEEIQYTSFNVFYRYYPAESFRGFFLGGQIGSTSVTREGREFDTSFPPNVVPVDESGSAMLAGILIGYGWLLGDAQRVAVSIGVGANRLFGDDVPDDASATLPVVRLINVGIAF